VNNISSGYGSNAAAPTTLHIFDVAESRLSFSSTFSPPPPSSTQTHTLPGPSRTPNSVTTPHPVTGSHAGSPTTTTDPRPGTHGINHNKRTTAIAVGVVFGVLGLLVAVAVVYYVKRRQHPRGERRFMALNRGDDGDDSDSARSTEGIPAARFYDGPASHNQRRWGFGLLDTIGLTSILSAATGGRTIRHIPERRDMLADEDTSEFWGWYDARSRDRSGGSVWSLRSIFDARIRSREPSATSTLGGMVWREKSDPFADDAAVLRDTETGYALSAVTAAGRPQGLRQTSLSRDYVQLEQVDDHVEDQATLLPRYVHASR
jgi:hypothetical protein